MNIFSNIIKYRLFSTTVHVCHRCTPVENPGYRIAQIFAQIPGGSGGLRLSGQNCQGSPILGFIVFLLTSLLKFACGYYVYTPPPPPVFIYDVCLKYYMYTLRGMKGRRVISAHFLKPSSNVRFSTLT
jgi:hypothetical protein